MDKISNIKNITEISGFGKYTRYEEACQKMLQVGWEWMNKNKNPKLKGHTYEGVYGIFKEDNKETKELSKAIVDVIPDCSGAMHQAVMGHLMFINKNGIEKWKEEVNKND